MNLALRFSRFQRETLAKLRRWQFVLSRAITDPVERVFTPGQARLLGWTAFLGHPLFYWLYIDVIPQPYDSLVARLLLSALGLAVAVAPLHGASRPWSALVWLFLWSTAPFFFFWLYFCNGNALWLSSAVIGIFVYYALNDWRMATVGVLTAAVAAWQLSLVTASRPPIDWSAQQQIEHIVVLLFTWYLAILIGAFSANRRRLQIRQALKTMEVMSHELRTPLATVSLIGAALRASSSELPPTLHAADRIKKSAARLELIARRMNHDIDLQVANVGLMNIPRPHELVNVAQVVRAAIDSYPRQNDAELAAITVVAHENFMFSGDELAFKKVMQNLLKNALRSLRSVSSTLRPGDIQIDISLQDRQQGRIIFSDRGCGMSEEIQASVFTPFFSTSDEAGQGLGLAYSRAVIRASGGTIQAQSQPGQGATFIIDLPAAD